jgi:outer membrane beta-barrel protein
MKTTRVKSMKRLVITLAVALAALMLPSVPEAKAQDVEVKGPLAGAPAVIGLRAYREMRFQIQAHVALTLQDQYSRTLIVGGQLMFHPTDWLGIGVWGGGGVVSMDTALTDEVTAKGQTNKVNVLSLPQASVFPEQVARLQWIAAPQVTFIPLRGKLGLFEKLFVDTDFYIFGGVGMVGLEERADVPGDVADSCRAIGDTSGFGAEVDCLSPTQTERSTRVAIAPTFGVGLSFYMTDFLAMTLEWRGLPFAWNTSGTDEAGDPRGDFPDGQIDDQDRLGHFNHMMTLGFAFYLPTSPNLAYIEEDGEVEADATEGGGKAGVQFGSKPKAKPEPSEDEEEEEEPADEEESEDAPEDE